LEDLAVRVQTQPLWVSATPQGPRVLSPGETVGWLTLKLQPGPYLPQQVRCYASNQGVMDLTTTDNPHVLHIKPKQLLQVGRTKFNCTTPHTDGAGVYLWWSYLVMKPHADGTWYSG
jgi:hypothetical protein